MKIFAQIVLTLMLLGTNAFACTCMVPEFSKDYYNSSNEVLWGQVKHVSIHKNDNVMEIEFVVYRSYKNFAKKSIKIRTNTFGSMCGLEVKEGEKWLLFVHKANGEFRVSSCENHIRFTDRDYDSQEQSKIRFTKLVNYAERLLIFSKDE